MPNKGAVMGVLHQLIIDSVSPDELRAQRVEVMRRIREKTGRHVLILAADPTKPAPFGPGSMLHTEDIPFFEELLSSTPRDADADVVIHSSGGLAEAAEQLSRMAKRTSARCDSSCRHSLRVPRPSWRCPAIA